MAIQKADLNSNKNERFQCVVSSVEKRIDEMLKADYEPGEVCRIDIMYLSCTEAVTKEIMKRFIAAGWTVKRHNGSDQRDGSWDYLDFS